MLKAIAFDLDDTLFPEEEYIISGFRAVAKWADEHLGIEFEHGFAQLRYIFKEGIRVNTFNEWLKYFKQFDDSLINTLVEIYRSHHPRQLQPFPEVPTLLERLSSRYKIGVISDGYLSVQQRKFAALGLERYFNAVIFSDRWGRVNWKPATRPYLEFLHTYNLEGRESVYVGDNPLKDFLGARRLGIWTIRVRRHGCIYSRYNSSSLENEPDKEIKNLNNLEDVLEQLQSN